jgi:hypothetical protein
MGMLHGRDAKAHAGEFRQQADHQARLAAAAPAGDSEYLHSEPMITAVPEHYGSGKRSATVKISDEIVEDE